MPATSSLESRGRAARSVRSVDAPPELEGDGSLVVAGFEASLNTTTIACLEATAGALDAVWTDRAFSSIPGIEEIGVVSTCHRVEVYVVSASVENIAYVHDALPHPGPAWVVRRGPEAVGHLYRVAAGLESLARGEPEVRGQVDDARRTVRSRHPRPLLKELFRRAAAEAGRLSSSAAPASESVARVAVGRLLSLTGAVRPNVVVVGSGHIGRQVVEHLAPHATVTVVYHRHPPGGPFLSATGAIAVPTSGWTDRLRTADALVTAAKFGHRGVRPDDLPSSHPLLVVDLGMPRNVDPAVRELPNVRLIDLGDLHADAEGSGPDARGPPAEVDAAAHACWEELARRLREPCLGAFRRAVEAVRRDELRLALAHLGELDARQLAALDRMTRRLVGRLLDPATERIRQIPSGPEGERWRRRLVEVLRPDRTET